MIYHKRAGTLDSNILNTTNLTTSKEYVIRNHHLKEDIENLLNSRAYDVIPDTFVILCHIDCIVEFLKQVSYTFE